MIRIFLFLLATTALTAAPPKLPPGITLEDNAAAAGKTKIVVIAGSNYYKPGEHDYLANCAVLCKLLEQNPGVAPVFAVDWPTKPETLTDAKAIVFFFDGGDKHAVLKENRAAEIDKLAGVGVGIVQLHQTADYPKDFGPRARSWTGGCWEKGASGRAHWVHEFKDFPKHAIFNGVTPFKIDDGWLYKLRFAEGMKGVTPLLRTDDPKAKAKPKPDDNIIAWAYEREKGRAFTFTGGHLHASFAEPGYRKFLVNGILWAAGQEIPEAGAKTDFDAKELDIYLTPKPVK
jgi:type 1 glutamine amidotransferase